MPVVQQDYERVSVIGLQGDFTGDETADAQKVVQAAISQRKIVDFVLDFQACQFIDSAGLEALIWIKRRCEEMFGRVKLINLDENVRKILEVTRLEPRFESCRDLATALKTMR